MKTQLPCFLVATFLFSAIASAPAQQPLGTAFTYQGQLLQNLSPANGNYNFQFLLVDSSTNCASGTNCNPVMITNVPVSNGLFTLSIDFGAGPFYGNNNFLKIAVATNGSSNFTALLPLQPVAPAPGAIFAENAGNLSGTLPSASLTGIYGGPLTLNNPNNSFCGNGGCLTNVNAATVDGFTAANLNYWSLTGNAGTTAGPNFLGTTDAQPLELHVNNQLRLRLDLQGNLISGGSSVGVGTSTASIVGGIINSIQTNATSTFIGGGSNNVISSGAYASLIVGGSGNVVLTNTKWASIGGGIGNNINGTGSVVGGGGTDGTTVAGNLIVANAATIGGGLGNNNNADYGTVGGGNANSLQAGATYSLIGGGNSNSIHINSLDSVLTGGIGNTIQANAGFSVIGGGQANQTFAGWSFIGSGNSNMIQINSLDSVLTGGIGNTIQANAGFSVIGGGQGNQTFSGWSFIGGGNNNIITTGTIDSTIGGGNANSNTANYATITGGSQNHVGGMYATVPGGYQNVALGLYSFAAGHDATANYDGDFVWSDGSAATASFTNNQFMARASSGFVLLTTAQASPASYASGTAGVALDPGATSWSTISDRNAKKNFEPVDGEAVLAKLAQVPVQRWNYKWEADDSVPHIGPMAQDFKAAFYPGRNDRSISTLEFDGVELAAIQGLNQKLNEKDTEIKTLKQQNDSLAERLNQLEATVKSLAEQK